MGLRQNIFTLQSIYELQEDSNWPIKSDVWLNNYPIQNLWEYGYFIGSFPSSSNTDRLDFSSDTTTLSPKSNLIRPIYQASTFSSANSGYVAGGNTPSTPTDTSSVQKIDYTNDSAAIVQTDTGARTNEVQGFGNTTNGYTIARFASNYIKYDFQSDTVSYPSARALVVKTKSGAIGNQNYGYIVGGSAWPSTTISTTRLERFDYSNDSSNPTPKGPLSFQKINPTGTSNSSYGWIIGGSPATSTLYRFDFSNETISPQPNFAASAEDVGATGNSNFGYVNSWPSSNINRLDYSNSTSIAARAIAARTFSLGVRATSSRDFGSTAVGGEYIPVPGRFNFDTGTAGTNPLPVNNPTEFIPWATTSYSIYGYAAGAYASSSAIERINYSNDAVNATARGPLSAGRYGGAGFSNSSYGYYAGGNSTSSRTTINRIDYSNDTGITPTVSFLVNSAYGVSGMGNNKYGYACSSLSFNLVQRITYASDTTNAIQRGNLVNAKWFGATVSNLNYGYYAGGTPGPTSTMCRINYANDVGNALSRANLPITASYFSGSGNSNYGYFSIGTRIERLDYSNDNISTSRRGNLTANGGQNSSTGSNNFGYFFGGSNFTIITRLDYANDTASGPTIGGKFILSKYLSAGISAGDRGLPN